jgi:hypothetical protein
MTKRSKFDVFSKVFNSEFRTQNKITLAKNINIFDKISLVLCFLFYVEFQFCYKLVYFFKEKQI